MHTNTQRYITVAFTCKNKHVHAKRHKHSHIHIHTYPSTCPDLHTNQYIVYTWMYTNTHTHTHTCTHCLMLLLLQIYTACFPRKLSKAPESKTVPCWCPTPPQDWNSLSILPITVNTTGAQV